VYAAIDKIDYDALKKFQAGNIANRPYTYCLLASDKKVKEKDMKKIGEVKKLSLEEIFGY
jgi:hypothetical protein